jgi:hypothetical protein
VRFSVNCLPVTTRMEGGTSPLADRLAALRKLALDGYPVGLTIAPIMTVDDWRDRYGELLDAVAAAIDGVPDPDLTAELITHRFTPGSKEVLLGWYPRTRLEMDEDAHPQARKVRRGQIRLPGGRHGSAARLVRVGDRLPAAGLPNPVLDVRPLVAARGVGAARAGDIARHSGVVRVVFGEPAGLRLGATLGQVGQVDRAFEFGLLVRLAGTHVRLLRQPVPVPRLARTHAMQTLQTLASSIYGFLSSQR